MKLYQRFAQLVDARLNCIGRGNEEWKAKHKDAIRKLEDALPCGSGFDVGTFLDIERSKPNRLVFLTSYHHMDEAGFYDGWTDHEVVVTPSLAFEFDLRITGRDCDRWKDYAAELFDYILREEVQNG